jgi:nucleoside-diphosphate-sugar epimerase
VLVSSLEAGYKVRAVVRRPAAAKQIKAAKSTQPFLGNLEIVFVEDLLKDGAYDEAVKDMDYVLHIASPVSRPSENYYADFIEPAVQGTLGLLRSASKSPSVKRVVITSSIAVLDIGRDAPLAAHDLGSVPAVDAEFPNSFVGYSASKRIALNEATKYIESAKPSFDVIHILPAVILGRNELVSQTSDFQSGTNRYAVNIALGNDAPNPMIGATVFVNDSADIHVKALDPRVKGNRNFLTASGSVVWADVNEIIKKEFPDAGLKLGGKMDTRPAVFDARETEEVFGIKWVGFEEQVKSVVGHYLEVEAKERN